MKFEKIHLDDITRCYCASHMDINGEPVIFFASEDPNSPCNEYSGVDFKEKEVLWSDERGGCLSIIPFETRKNEFLAINEFYLKVSPSHAKLIWGKKDNDGWHFKDIFNFTKTIFSSIPIISPSILSSPYYKLYLLSYSKSKKKYLFFINT